MKCRRKALLNCSKLSIDDVGNLVNHSLAAPLRVVGKERHRISFGGYLRPNVVLNALRCSLGSLSLSNGSSLGNRNFNGTGHSRTTAVKGESAALTSLSRERGLVWSLLLRLSPSSSRLPLDWLSSYCSRSFISWFCLVSSSTVAAST